MQLLIVGKSLIWQACWSVSCKQHWMMIIVNYNLGKGFHGLACSHRCPECASRKVSDSASMFQPNFSDCVPSLLLLSHLWYIKTIQSPDWDTSSPWEQRDLDILSFQSGTNRTALLITFESAWNKDWVYQSWVLIDLVHRRCFAKQLRPEFRKQWRSSVAEQCENCQSHPQSFCCKCCTQGLGRHRDESSHPNGRRSMQFHPGYCKQGWCCLYTGKPTQRLLQFQVPSVSSRPSAMS